MSRRVRWLLALFGLFVGGSLLVALVPITLVLPEGQDPREGWDVVPISVPTGIVIEHEGSGQVQLSLPYLRFPESFNAEEQVSDYGPFLLDEKGWSLTADQPGELRIRGVFGDVEIGVSRLSVGSVLSVTRSLPERVVHQRSIEGNDVGPAGASIVLPSPTEKQVRKLPLFSGLQAPELVEADVYIGGHLIQGGVRGPEPMTLVKVAVGAVIRATGLMTTALAVVVVCWFLGRLFVARRPGLLGLHAGIGFSALAIATNTLAYIMGVRSAAWVIVTGVSVSLLVAVRGGLLKSAGRELWRSMGGAVVLTPILLVSSFPLLEWGSWYAGNYKTDLFEYGALSSLVRSHSLFEMQTLPVAQQSGVLTAGAGFVWRSIDSVFASLLSYLAGLSTVGGINVLGLILIVLFGLGLVDLSWISKGGKFWAVGLLLLHPLFTSLYVENYLSQFFFVALIPTILLVCSEVLAAHRYNRQTSSVIALSVVSAAIIAVYPHYFFAMGVGLIMLAWSFRQYRPTIRKLAVPTVVTTALMVNLAWITVFNLPELSKYEPGLDAIAENVLLAGFDRGDLAEIGLGIKSYHWRHATVEVDGGDGVLPAVVKLAKIASDPPLWWSLLGVGGLVLLFLRVRYRSTFASFEGRASWGVFIIWIGVAAAYAVSSHPYAGLKAGWTGLALLPVLLAASQWRASATVITGVSVVLVGGIWATTTVADRFNWLPPNPGSEVSASYVSVVPDLVRLEDLIREESGLAVVAYGAQPLKGSGLDRVLLAQTQILLRDRNVPCPDCAGLNLDRSSIGCGSRETEMLVVIGLTREDSLCGLSLRESGEYLEVFGR